MEDKNLVFNKLVESPLKIKDSYGGRIVIEPSWSRYNDNLFSPEKLFFKTDVDGIVLTKEQWEQIKLRVDEILN